VALTLRDGDASLEHIKFLFHDYVPGRWWFEVVDMYEGSAVLLLSLQTLKSWCVCALHSMVPHVNRVHMSNRYRRILFVGVLPLLSQDSASKA